MPEINAVVDLVRHGDIAVLTVNSPPVNALSTAVRSGLKLGVERAGDDPQVHAIVLICAGRTFIAGADIAEFGKPPQEPSLRSLIATIEAVPKPVVAAIHGTALGGGLELALACHYRVAVPSAKVGLPEVKLGLLPGAGGTQRLPRLTGVAQALDVILTGEPIDAEAAHRSGILDALVGEGRLREEATAYARRLAAEGAPLRKLRDDLGRLAAERGRDDLFEAARRAHARRLRGTAQLDYIIECIRAARDKSFEEGLAIERDRFLKLLQSDESAAMRYLFFAEREVWKIPDVAKDTPVMPIDRVGIVGAGTMGGGIAMNFLNVGLPVTIVEASRDALDRGLAVIGRNYQRSVERGRLSAADVDKRMSLLTGSLSVEALADSDLVIEAVYEDMAVKKEVFARLDAAVKANAILATNTSYLDVNAIARTTKRPHHVLALHFFSPANVMRLVEVVRGEATAKPVLATAMALARRIGKIAVVVGVCHGFVGNRMLAQRQREANRLILEGAMPWDVDRVLTDFGMPMGPFAMSDLAGLDLGWSRATSRGETVCEILCEMDRRGQKTGAGYYDYDEHRRPTPSAVTEKIVLELSARLGMERRTISEEEILERCIYPMINEGAKILAERKALRASDIDVIWVNGYGWPTYRGGPMYYGEQVGLAQVLRRLRDLEARHGSDFKASALLERMVESTGSFTW